MRFFVIYGGKNSLFLPAKLYGEKSPIFSYVFCVCMRPLNGEIDADSACGFIFPVASIFLEL